MSASDHFGPQLQMFVPAGALADPSQVRHGDQRMSETSHGMAARKVEDARTSEQRCWTPDEYEDRSLYGSIKAVGVDEPVDVSISPDKPVLMDGHHRVFTAADIDPKTEVPVQWWSTHA